MNNEDLFLKIEKLKNDLNKLEIFSSIDQNLFLIRENKELINKIEQYNISKNSNLRQDIYNYQEIKEYKQNENTLNYMILEMNRKLNKITDRRGCSHESN